MKGPFNSAGLLTKRAHLINFLSPVKYIAFNQTIGEDVHRSKPEKFSELLLRVRQTLINPPPNLQSDSLATLLLLLESHLLRWPSALPEKTGEISRQRTHLSNTLPGEWYAEALGSPLQLRKAPTMLSQPQMPRSNGHSPRVREVGA